MSLDVSLYNEAGVELYTDNITHNLNKMAMEAGIYEVLWRPGENGYVHAIDIIDSLGEGLIKLASDYQHYMKFNSPNGWGMWEHFVPFVAKYLAACKQWPEATIVVSR